MSLTLKQLRYFVEICAEGSFSGAAQRLRVAQPALSYQIGRLEQFLGAALFTRTHKGVVPTDSGELLLTHARLILGQVGETVTAFRDRAATVTGAVSVGFLNSVAPFLAPLLASECRRRFPDVTLSVAEGDNRLISERLRAGSLDMGVTLPAEGQGTELPLVVEEVFFYTPRGGAAAGRKSISLKEAFKHKLVLPTSQQSLRILIETCAGAQNLPLSIEVEAGYATMKSLVEAGIGCGVATFAAFKTEFEAGTFDAAVLTDPPVTRTLVLASSREERTDQAMAGVRQILLQSITQLAPALRWQLCPLPDEPPAPGTGGARAGSSSPHSSYVLGSAK